MSPCGRYVQYSQCTQIDGNFQGTTYASIIIMFLPWLLFAECMLACFQGKNVSIKNEYACIFFLYMYLCMHALCRDRVTIDTIDYVHGIGNTLTHFIERSTF
jgi:hypothetical protein